MSNRLGVDRILWIAFTLALVSTQAAGQQVWFETPVRKQCSGDAVREWAAIITGRNYSGDWVQACRTTTAQIAGASFPSRNCGWAGGRVWGKFDVPDETCRVKIWFQQPIEKQCSGDGMREWAAIITGANYSGDWVQACRTTTAQIAGASYQSRSCGWAGGRVWGKFDVPDKSCVVKLWFEEPEEKECVRTGVRQYAAIITGSNFSGDWVTACARTTAKIAGSERTSNECRWIGSRVWGKFYVEDPSCGIPQPPPAKFPGGSYLQSCIPIAFENGQLKASCLNFRGQPKASSRNEVNLCVSDIMNVNGSIECSIGALPPSGPYQQRCPYVWYNAIADVLSAYCPGWDGLSEARPLLDVSKCVHPIVFLGGALDCTPEALPPGSYMESCRDMWVNDGVLHATCRNPRGEYYASELQLPCSQDVVNDRGELRCGPPPTVPAPNVIGMTMERANGVLANAGIAERASGSCVGYYMALLRVEEQRPGPGEPLIVGEPLWYMRCSRLPEQPQCQQPSSFSFAAQCGVYCQTWELGASCNSEAVEKQNVEKVNVGCTVTVGRCTVFDLVAICPNKTCSTERHSAASFEAAKAIVLSNPALSQCTVERDTGQLNTARCRP